jgi:hypothetical protein
VSPESQALVERLVGQVRNEHWRTLELASTIDFLEHREKCDREVALSRALGLKPACRDRKDDALRLLDTLALPAG